MDDREKQIRQRLKNDFEHYAAKCLKIRTKAGDIHALELNQAQKYIHQQLTEQLENTGKIRAIILKGRQQGCSTYVEARLYWRVTHRRGVRAFILTHEQEASNNLFEMAQRYHEHCHPLVRPEIEASNAKELHFGLLDSGYRVGTAGNKSVGRSSTVQYFHGSEVAFWPNAEEHAKGILQTIPDQPGTEIILESTANGLGNYYHQQWQLAESGQSDYVAIFVPWFWQDEYRKALKDDFSLTEEEQELKQLYQLDNEQLAWRRAKITELSANGADGVISFQQEYPCNAAEAFQTSGTDCFIQPEIVMRARKCIAPESGQLLIGVDPARFGDDRTSIIRRRTRHAFKLELHSKKDTMQVTGIVKKIIDEEKPAGVFIDVIGIGAGIVDRLREMGYSDIVIPVNGGDRPLDAEKYFNKRAENWGVMKNWLLEQPCQIPDNDELHADLCSLTYSFDSNSRLKLERKEDMKKRGLRSPDTADALALTFARPVANQSKTLKLPELGIV